MGNAFDEPNKAEKELICQHLTQLENLEENIQSEYQESVRGIHAELVKAVRSYTVANFRLSDGQNHFFGLRALNDPTDKKDLEDILKQKDVQLASEEFFGVNRFVEFLPDLADVQWRAIYKNSNWYNDAWCPEGEHLASGSQGYGQLWGAEIVVNGKRLSPQEIISFYRNLNKRRNSAFRADAKKMGEPLRKVFSGEAISDSESVELRRFGLIDGQGELTYAGACCLEVGVPQEKQLRSLHRKDHLAKLKEAILAVDLSKYHPKGTLYFTPFVRKKLKKLLTTNLKSIVQGNYEDTEQLNEMDQQFRQELQVSLCDLLGIGMIQPHFAYDFLRPFDRKLKPFVGSLANVKKQTIDHLIKKLGKEELASGVYHFLSDYFVSQPLSSHTIIFSQLHEFMDETDILEEEKVKSIFTDAYRSQLVSLLEKDYKTLAEFDSKLAVFQEQLHSGFQTVTNLEFEKVEFLFDEPQLSSKLKKKIRQLVDFKKLSKGDVSDLTILENMAKRKSFLPETEYTSLIQEQFISYIQRRKNHFTLEEVVGVAKLAGTDGQLLKFSKSLTASLGLDKRLRHLYLAGLAGKSFTQVVEYSQEFIGKYVQSPDQSRNQNHNQSQNKSYHPLDLGKIQAAITESIMQELKKSLSAPNLNDLGELIKHVGDKGRFFESYSLNNLDKKSLQAKINTSHYKEELQRSLQRVVGDCTLDEVLGFNLRIAAYSSPAERENLGLTKLILEKAEENVNYSGRNISHCKNNLRTYQKISQQMEASPLKEKFLARFVDYLQKDIFPRIEANLSANRLKQVWSYVTALREAVSKRGPGSGPGGNSSSNIILSSDQNSLVGKLLATANYEHIKRVAELSSQAEEVIRHYDNIVIDPSYGGSRLVKVHLPEVLTKEEFAEIKSSLVKAGCAEAGTIAYVSESQPLLQMTIQGYAPNLNALRSAYALAVLAKGKKLGENIKPKVESVPRDPPNPKSRFDSKPIYPDDLAQQEIISKYSGGLENRIKSYNMYNIDYNIYNFKKNY